MESRVDVSNLIAKVTILYMCHSHDPRDLWPSGGTPNTLMRHLPLPLWALQHLPLVCTQFVEGEHWCDTAAEHALYFIKTSAADDLFPPARNGGKGLEVMVIMMAAIESSLV